MDIFNEAKRKLLGRHLAARKLDSTRDRLINMADEIGNRFAHKLCLQIISCCREDILELYGELSELKLDEGLFEEDFAALNRLYVNLAHYQALMFLNNERSETSREEILKALRLLFPPERGDRALFSALESAPRETAEIELAISQRLIDEIPGLNCANPSSLALIGNFLYNSYKGFIESFTHYVPINSETLLTGRIQAQR